ncbi:MAG: hypothetical protein PHQ98_02365 [Candidatus ainarchaeum sp.]|nr:hypothetical protein [Candidatus ainarchaeum sp.]
MAENVIFDLFGSIIQSFYLFLPELFAALLIIIIGYIICLILKKIVIKIFDSLNIDSWFEEQNLNTIFGSKSISEIVGFIVMWGLFFVFLQEGLSILKLATLTMFVGTWLNFLIRLIVAIIIILVSMIIGRYIRNAIEGMDYLFNHVVALLVELVIIYISIVMGITVIGLPTFLLEMTFLIILSGAVIAFSLTIGLSFGLALKDDAKLIIKDIRETEKNHNKKKHSKPQEDD